MSTNSTSESRELVETPDLNGAYPRLDEAGIAALAPLGRRRRVQPEEILFREGDRECQFFVVLAGKVASVEGHGTPEERVISVHGRGRFLGELSLLTGEGSYYTAVAVNADMGVGFEIADEHAFHSLTLTSGVFQIKCCPPSTASIWPVTDGASSR